MYYLFIGQLETTTGTSHNTTGRLNIFGDLMPFNTLAERNDFFKNAYSNVAGISIVKTNQRQAKSRFYGGLTQDQYISHICYIDSHMIDYNRYNLNIVK